MGVEAEVQIVRPGYVPKGGGHMGLKIAPLKRPLKPLHLVTQGRVMQIRGIALASHLKEREVSRRMARECEKVLKERGFRPEIEVLYDEKGSPAFEAPSIQPGAALAVWAETDTGCLIGADMAGTRGRTAEFLADQVIPFAALAEGTSTFRIPSLTEHVEARLWLAEKILGATCRIGENFVTVEGIGR
jgi:RNA 3'-terminal phosphate cyclase (ATP)